MLAKKSNKSYSVFICYAREDNTAADVTKRWLDRLLQHLQPLVLRKQLSIWSDLNLEAGHQWHQSIQAILQDVKAAVLLVSPAFMASKYIKNFELPLLLKNAKQKGVVLLPIILRPCLFNETDFLFPDPDIGPEKLSLASLEAVNPLDRPLNGLSEEEQDRVLLSVAQYLLHLASQEQSSDPVHLFPDSEKRIAVLRLPLKIQQFDAQNQRRFCNAIARFVEIAPEEVQIISIEEGSVRVRVELPAPSRKKLLRALRRNDSVLRDFLSPFILREDDPDRSEPILIHMLEDQKFERYLPEREVEQAYELAYVLHPQKDVAIRVVIDAFHVLSLLRESQARRRSSTPYRAMIPTESLLQFAVFMVSYVRETDQESAYPVMEPLYRPTLEDLIVRYVKHLVWRTSLRNSSYVAVGIGCWLYSYRPSEIADLGLGFFDSSNIRRTKTSIGRDLARRFTSSLDPMSAGNAFRTITADDHHVALVRGSLKAFTPWLSSHARKASGESLVGAMFDPEGTISEWDRKHALIDPECAGLEYLIREYNQTIRDQFADPIAKLRIPVFGGMHSSLEHRFNSEALSPAARRAISEAHEPSRAWSNDIKGL